MSVKPVPQGYHTVTPYILTQRVGELIDFMKAAFDASEMHRMAMPDGSIRHAEVRIGDSVVMLGDPGDPSRLMPAFIHLYVNDCEAVYRKALSAGASSMTEPADQFYGDRSAGVKDPTGNVWWIATHKEDVSPEELRRRMAQHTCKKD